MDGLWRRVSDRSRRELHDRSGRGHRPRRFHIHAPAPHRTGGGSLRPADGDAPGRLHLPPRPDLRALRPRLGSERGTATVELALAAPVILLVLVSLVDLGRVGNTYAMVRAASEEGARYAIVHTDADATAITAYVRGRAALVDASRLEVDTTFYDGAQWRARRASPFPPPAPSAMPVRVQGRDPLSAGALAIRRFFPRATTAATPLDA